MTTREGGADVARWQWSVDAGADGVLVLRLSGRWLMQDHLPRRAAVDARWRVLDRSGRELAARVSRLREPGSAGTTAAAMSRALGALSRDIAREIGTTDGGRP